MKTATAVVLVALLVTIIAAAGAHAQTVSPVNALLVVDANGKTVRPAVWAFIPGGQTIFEQQYEIPMQVSGRLFGLTVYPVMWTAWKDWTMARPAKYYPSSLNQATAQEHLTSV